MQTRFKAAETFIVQKLTSAFKTDYYDGEKEQFKMAELNQFVESVATIRQMTQVDDDLASAMAGAKI